MTRVGTRFISSNKIGLDISAIKIFLFIFLCALNGFIFSIFIIFLNLTGFWLLVSKLLFAYACVQITKIAISSLKNRNRKLTYIIALLVSFMSWYTMWAMNLSDFEEINFISSLMHPYDILILFCKVQQYEEALFLPDTLAFFLSIIIVYESSEDVIGLYCETCKRYYFNQTIYFHQGESFSSDIQDTTPGIYHFISRYEPELNKNVFDKKINKENQNTYTFAEVSYYSCHNGQDHTFITIRLITKSIEWKNDEPEIIETTENTDVDKIYVDTETAKIIEEKIALSKKAMNKADVKN